jgi:hypothetical protein
VHHQQGHIELKVELSHFGLDRQRPGEELDPRGLVAFDHVRRSDDEYCVGLQLDDEAGAAAALAVRAGGGDLHDSVSDIARVGRTNRSRQQCRAHEQENARSGARQRAHLHDPQPSSRRCVSVTALDPVASAARRRANAVIPGLPVTAASEIQDVSPNLWIPGPATRPRNDELGYITNRVSA